MELEDDNLGWMRPVPSEFHSFSLDGPFRQCQVCECDLFAGETPYLIEKALKGDEVIFEHAVCLSCGECMRQSYSRESLEAIEKFFEERVDWEARHRAVSEADPDALEQWLDRCLVTGKPRSELKAYQIYGLCLGPQMIVGDTPFLISEDIIDELQELLSAETRGEIDRYTRDHLNRLPDFDKILGGPRPILL